MASREDGNAKPMTVKIIETVYVEADTADDFKSVVQRLTGKDAVGELEEGSSKSASSQAARSRMGQGSRSLGDSKDAGASGKRQNR